MNGEYTRAEILIHKFLNNEITSEEGLELNNWYNQNLDQQIEIPEDFALSEELHRQRILKVIQQSIRINPIPANSAQPAQTKLSKKQTIQLWPRIAIAASIIIALTTGIYFLKDFRSPIGNQTSEIKAKNDIPPGTIGATLTLANGKKIKLSQVSNGEIAQQTGIIVTKTADGQIIYHIKKNTDKHNEVNTLTTAKGETYTLTLPDKSKVWINAASSLTYNANLFDHGQRKVKLVGEAYFEISKDKAHPFIVESRGQQVEVLGTHFNINAYNDEPDIKTTLLEGRVSVAKMGKIDPNDPWSNPFPPAILSPGEQAILKGIKMNVVKVDPEQAIAWKSGKFMFENGDIKSIMRMVERWYNVEVVYVNDVSGDTLYGTVSRFENVSSVLRILEAAGDIHFRIEGRKIYVSR